MLLTQRTIELIKISAGGRHYVLHSLATMQYGWPIEVELELSLEEARRRLPPDTGTFEPVKGGVVLRCQADNLDWMVRTLVYAGCGFKVVRPPELRDALRATARSISRLSRRGERQARKNTESPGRTMAVEPEPAYVA